MISEVGDANSQQPFKDHLRAELISAAKRKNDKRARNQRVAKGGILAVVVLFAVSAALVIHPQRSDASVLNIQRNGNTTTVSLKVLTTSPTEITKELRHNGINAHVTTAPVADPIIGNFTSVQTLSPNSSATPTDPKSGAFVVFTLESGIDLDLTIGRKAKPGENYVTFYDALLPGGVLHCSGIIGKRLDQASAQLGAHATGFVYRQVNASGTYTESTAADSASMYVAQVNSRSSDKLIVTVSADPQSATPEESAGC